MRSHYGIDYRPLGEVVYRGLKYGLYDTFKDPIKTLFNIEEENKIGSFFLNWFIGWFISNVAATIGMSDLLRIKNQP